MADYANITGFITDIFEGESGSGTPYLGIKFYTDDAHDNDEGRHVIKLWFSGKSLEYDQDKVERLCGIAKVPYKKPATIAAAVKLMTRAEFAALEIPIQVTPNEYNDKVSAQYNIGFSDGVVSSSFDKFDDIIKEKLAKVKAAKPEPAESAEPVDDDGIPF